MRNIVSIFRDCSVCLENAKGKTYLEAYFGSVINNNVGLRKYVGEYYEFQYVENAESLISNYKTSNPIIIFIPAELKQDNHLRSSFRGLSLVKRLRKNRIKQPIVLFSFLNDEKDFNFCDKDDFINAEYMQFFVRLPELYLLQNADEHKPLRLLSDDELDELLDNQYDKKQKASILLDKLLEDLKQIPDDDKYKSVGLIKNTLQTMVMWAPKKASHAIYQTVLPNKLKRLEIQSQRIALLNQYRSRLLEGIAKDYDGLLA